MLTVKGDLHDAHIQPELYKTPPFTVEAPDYKPVPGETIPRRHPKSAKELADLPAEGITTLYDVLLRSGRDFGGRDAFGTRPLIKMHYEVKKIKKIVGGKEELVDKKWTYFEMGDYVYTTYNQYVDLAVQIGAGLRKLGLKKDDRIHIFAATRSVILWPVRGIYL